MGRLVSSQRKVAAASPEPPVTLLDESLWPPVTVSLIEPMVGVPMRAKHPGVPIDSSAAAHDAARRGRDALSRSTPTSPESAGSQPDHRDLASADGTVAERSLPSVAGQLSVRWQREDGRLIMWLDGALDEATVTLLDRELDSRAIGLMYLVVDLTGLELIDAPGLEALVRVHWCASKRGAWLFFRHGRRVAQRPIELTRTVRLRSREASLRQP
jgi:anti-anti-sigma regulatory factor